MSTSHHSGSHIEKTCNVSLTLFIHIQMTNCFFFVIPLAIPRNHVQKTGGNRELVGIVSDSEDSMDEGNDDSDPSTDVDLPHPVGLASAQQGHSRYIYICLNFCKFHIIPQFISINVKINWLIFH